MATGNLERNKWDSESQRPLNITSSAAPEGSDPTESISPAIHVVDNSYNTIRDGTFDGDTDSDSDEEAGLDPEGRRNRRHRREQNTTLDGRVGDQAMSAKEERKLADMDVLKRSAINVLLILLWYTFSVSISVVCTFEGGD
jgi:hypothetical protein